MTSGEIDWQQGNGDPFNRQSGTLAQCHRTAPMVASRRPGPTRRSNRSPAPAADGRPTPRSRPMSMTEAERRQALDPEDLSLCAHSFDARQGARR